MDKLERARCGTGSATCAYLLVDPAAETVTISLAGHLPPALRHPDGRVELLAGGLSVPLAGLGVPHVQQARRLPAGSTLVAYTDGLVERRDESIDDGLRRLGEALAELGGDPAAICDSLPARLIGAAPPADDLALVALRVDVPAGDGHLRERDSAPVRQAVRPPGADVGPRRPTVSPS